MDLIKTIINEYATILSVFIGIVGLALTYLTASGEKQRARQWVIWATIIAVVFTLIVLFQKGKTPSDDSGENETVDTSVQTDSTAGLGQAENRIISSMEASSTYTGDRVSHSVYNLTDDNLSTNWTEGVDGQGVGEYIEFTLKKEYLLTEMEIFAGNHDSDNYYEWNSRPKGITLTFSDGSSQSFVLRDSRTCQTIDLNPQVTADRVRLTIDSVYPGSKWEDTVISQVSFTGYAVP